MVKKQKSKKKVIKTFKEVRAEKRKFNMSIWWKSILLNLMMHVMLF